MIANGLRTYVTIYHHTCYSKSQDKLSFYNVSFLSSNFYVCFFLTFYRRENVYAYCGSLLCYAKELIMVTYPINFV